jgi:mRNA deadenylase 3'-5' endonuclease subunit Ccr4
MRCQYLYPELQQKLGWEERKKLLMDDLVTLNAEVYCLQEVQHEHYVDVFEPFFNKGK